jgi:peptidoglycan/LPS O-acetylase OafA/YrhL
MPNGYERVNSVVSVANAVRSRAQNTPQSRERLIDFLRAWAICMVVLGHWTITSLDYRDGVLVGENAVRELDWIHPVSWLFQVMPVFFLVGGFSNAASLTSYLRGNRGRTGWVLHRTDRLLRPATALLVAIPAAALAAVLAGADTEMVGESAWLVSLPLWFLLAYLAMVTLAPWTHALHRRFGWAVPGILVAAVGLCDLLRIGLDVPYVGEATYLLAWLAIHQIGYFWHDRRLPTDRLVAGAIAVVGFVTLLLLTVAGPYEILMVGGNTNPPTLALLALAATQLGVILVVREPMNRMLQRPRVWTGVVAVNAVILTIFLWHMTAALLTAIIVYPSGLFTEPPIDSGQWLAWRVPWLVACAVVLVVLVGLFARIELTGTTPPPLQGASQHRSPLLVWMGLAATAAGLLGVALSGPDYHGPGALPPWSVLAYLAGAALLRTLRVSHAASRRK